MSFNVHFLNLEICDFVSKNARNKMKEFIKKKINLNNPETFNSIKSEIINRFLKKDLMYDLDLEYIIENNDFKLELKKTVSDFQKKNNLRKNLREKIKNLRSSNINQKNLKHYKQENKTLLKDKRVTKEMISFYYKAKSIIKKNVPNPIEILDNKNKYIDEIFQHLLNLSQKCESKDKLLQVMNNDYINYIQLVCDFDYKKYLDQFFRKIKEMSDLNSNLPDMIKNVPDNSVDEKNLDNNVIEQLDDNSDLDDNISLNSNE
jgi:hypothetical protein